MLWIDHWEIRAACFLKIWKRFKRNANAGRTGTVFPLQAVVLALRQCIASKRYTTRGYHNSTCYGGRMLLLVGLAACGFHLRRGRSSLCSVQLVQPEANHNSWQLKRKNVSNETTNRRKQRKGCAFPSYFTVSANERRKRILHRIHRSFSLTLLFLYSILFYRPLAINNLHFSPIRCIPKETNFLSK